MTVRATDLGPFLAAITRPAPMFLTIRQATRDEVASAQLIEDLPIWETGT